MGSEEPMDVDSTADFDKFDDLLEEGEYVELESNHITRKPLASTISVPVDPGSRLENKAGTFITGVDIFSKHAKEKIEERAKRFGISNEAAERSIVTEAENLYESFGIDEDTENAKNYRLNVLHMRGTENLNTKDIFKYFEDYAPASIEWISDISCNVVWLDKESAARAILGLSKKIVGSKKVGSRRSHSDEDSDEDSDDDLEIVNGKTTEVNTIHVKDIRCPVPPGIWRKGQTYKESRNIFLRFATHSDRKHPQTEKLGLKGILTSSRKRILKQIKEPSPPLVKTEPGTNGIVGKNPWGSLSKNWGVTDFVEDDYLPKVPLEPVSNVKERLGFKSSVRESREERENTTQKKPTVIELSDESEDESSSEEENWCKRRKIPRMRMHADDEEEKIQKRKGKIRQLVSENVQISGNDLRGRLVARRRLPKPIIHEDIQVVVTNPKAFRSGNFRNINVTEDEDEGEENDIEVVVEPDDDEEEEGEIIDDSESDDKVEYIEEDEEEDYRKSESESESSSSNDSSDESTSEKEIQGPKGSVIKVVQNKPKPRLQSTVSTVWSRLNHSKRNRSRDSSKERYTKSDLRYTLNKTDLRSRIGNHHMRGRSPLRIELRNDKYAGRLSDSE